MNLRISGDKSRLQSSLDFYLKITSVSQYKNLEALRKGMFSKFMEEEKGRESSYLSIDRNEEVINLAKEQEERLEGELVQDNVVEKGRFVEDYVEEKRIPEELKEKRVAIEEIEEPEIIEEVAEVVEEKESSVKEVHAYIEESEQDKERYLKHKKELEQNCRTMIEYVEHGIYLEDYVEDGSFEKEDVVEEIVELTYSEIDVEYVEHGIYLEDYVEEEVVEEDVVGEDESSYELEDEEDESSYELEDEENEIEIEDIEDLIVEESDESSDTVQDIGDWMDSVLSENQGKVLEEELVESKPEEKLIEEPLKPKVKEPVVDNSELEMSFMQGEVDDVVSEKEDIIVKPANIRDFIRQHPNSSVEFVMKYYSKKEIDKALKLAKIYKKNGKLCI